MSDEIEPNKFGEDEILTEHVKARIEAAKRLVEMCGCKHCRVHLQSWLDWRNMVTRGGGNEVPPEPTPPSPSDLPPDHPKFGPDDPPPPFDSGRLSEWYASGMG